MIELGGSQYLEQEQYDRERTEFLESKGYRVLCFWNQDVMRDVNVVFQVIGETLADLERDQNVSRRAPEPTNRPPLPESGSRFLLA